MYYEKTGDLQAREDAMRSLNYATYFADDEGKIACCGLDYADSYWFDDGYADHVRNYQWAMGAVARFRPRRRQSSSPIVLSCDSHRLQRDEYRIHNVRLGRNRNSASQVRADASQLRDNIAFNRDRSIGRGLFCETAFRRRCRGPHPPSLGRERQDNVGGVGPERRGIQSAPSISSVVLFGLGAVFHALL